MRFSNIPYWRAFNSHQLYQGNACVNRNLNDVQIAEAHSTKSEVPLLNIFVNKQLNQMYIYMWCMYGLHVIARRCVLRGKNVSQTEYLRDSLTGGDVAKTVDDSKKICSNVCACACWIIISLFWITMRFFRSSCSKTEMPCTPTPASELTTLFRKMRNRNQKTVWVVVSVIFFIFLLQYINPERIPFFLKRLGFDNSCSGHSLTYLSLW